MRDLRCLPKANLHVHLTGSMRPGTMTELAARHRLPLPSLSGARSTRFLEAYDAAREVLRDPEDIARVVAEAITDNTHDGAHWMELQVDPTPYAELLGSPEAVIETMLAAARDSFPATGTGVGLIIAGSWARPAEHAVKLAELAVRFAPHGVVGFGLSNDERRGSPSAFTAAFRIATEAGLASVPHSGAIVGPDHVADCVTELRAERIGHGITAHTDASVMRLLAERQVTLEICPASYAGFGIVPDVSAVPVRTFLRAGVPVALGSDDPLIFGAGLLDQYQIARDALGLSDEEIAHLALSSIAGSRAPRLIKRRMADGVAQWLSGPADITSPSE
ncbi:adenosine deaminase [Streptomyces wedmorensis]